MSLVSATPSITISTERHLANGDFTQEIVIDGVAETRLIANRDRAPGSHFHCGRNDVAFPVTFAGRHISGQTEIRQRGERNVVCPPNARLQHAATPDRNSRRLSRVVHALGLAKSTYAAELDIDDAAGAQLDGLLGVMRRADAFIQTDGRLQLRLQLGMIDD